MKNLLVTMALAFLAIPTIASAHGGNNDPNVVHACIGNVSKVVRIVGVTGSCIVSPALAAETPAHWGIQGPQGCPRHEWRQRHERDERRARNQWDERNERD
jgi:hypothetical protein